MSAHSHHAPKPRRKLKTPEQIGLAVVLYGQAAITAVVCLLLAFIILDLHLLPNLFYRLASVVFLVAIVVVYLPMSVKDVYDEVGRR